MGIATLVSPGTLKQLLYKLLQKKWLAYVTIFRILIGILLAIAAPQTKAPQFIWALGILFILAGVVIPFIGIRRIEWLANWWLERSDMVLRMWAAIATLLGIAIIWAGI
jgi:hypothetical protein